MSPENAASPFVAPKSFVSVPVLVSVLALDSVVVSEASGEREVSEVGVRWKEERRRTGREVLVGEALALVDDLWKQQSAVFLERR